MLLSLLGLASAGSAMPGYGKINPGVRIWCYGTTTDPSRGGPSSTGLTPSGSVIPLTVEDFAPYCRTITPKGGLHGDVGAMAAAVSTALRELSCPNGPGSTSHGLTARAAAKPGKVSLSGSSSEPHVTGQASQGAEGEASTDASPEQDEMEAAEAQGYLPSSY